MIRLDDSSSLHYRPVRRAAATKPIRLSVSPRRAARHRRHVAVLSSARRRRRILSLVCGLVGVVALGLLAFPNAGVGASHFRQIASSPEPGLPVERGVIVNEGDSLWSLASRFGSSNRPIPEIVQEVASRNHRSPDAPIHPGEVLYISEAS